MHPPPSPHSDSRHSQCIQPFVHIHHFSLHGQRHRHSLHSLMHTHTDSYMHSLSTRSTLPDLILDSANISYPPKLRSIPLSSPVGGRAAMAKGNNTAVQAAVEVRVEKITFLNIVSKFDRCILMRVCVCRVFLKVKIVHCRVRSSVVSTACEVNSSFCATALYIRTFNKSTAI